MKQLFGFGLSLILLAATAQMARADALTTVVAAPPEAGSTIDVTKGEEHKEGELHELCGDRPLKGFGACSVDKGHFQLETDFFNVTHDRSNGVTTDLIVGPNPTLKYGVTDNIDVEANFAPYQILRVKDADGTESHDGIGDLTLALKWHLFGENGHDGLALYPFVKIPTANHYLGNGAVEGGLIVPWQKDIIGGWSVNISPEVDVFKDSDGDGRHAAATASIGFNHPLAEVWNVGFELWGQRDFDPGANVSRYSFDMSLAYQPKGASWAVDAEVDVGLNRNTPDTQFIVGLTKRF